MNIAKVIRSKQKSFLVFVLFVSIAVLFFSFSTVEVYPIKLDPIGSGNVKWKEVSTPNAPNAIMKNSLELDYRQLRAPYERTADAKSKVNCNNMVQEYIETLNNVVCIPAVCIDDPRSGDVSNWPCNLGLAAAFDSQIGAQYGKMMSYEWCAMGISMQVALQMHLSTEPRWICIPETIGEDPVLSFDKAKAVINGWQSTYDDDGNDIVWVKKSVNNQMQHFSGDGAVEGGRESQASDGTYNIFPGGQFFTHTLPFLACMNLTGKTKTVTAAVTNFSIGIEKDGSQVEGERLGTSFSKYKINKL